MRPRSVCTTRDFFRIVWVDRFATLEYPSLDPRTVFTVNQSGVWPYVPAYLVDGHWLAVSCEPYENDGGGRRQLGWTIVDFNGCSPE
jgi:hypothetical protein